MSPWDILGWALAVLGVTAIVSIVIAAIVAIYQTVKETTKRRDK